MWLDNSHKLVSSSRCETSAESQLCILESNDLKCSCSLIGEYKYTEITSPSHTLTLNLYLLKIQQKHIHYSSASGKHKLLSSPWKQQLVKQEESERGWLGSDDNTDFGLAQFWAHCALGSQVHGNMQTVCSSQGCVTWPTSSVKIKVISYFDNNT